MAPAERLTYRPGLDGLRGVAIAGVLLYHGDVAHSTGGFLGVSLFFTLSGFLITSLLLAERADTGRVRLLAFWGRRARRLVPASVAALLFAALVTAWVVPASQQRATGEGIIAALFNVHNWYAIASGVPYVDLTSVPSPVQHYWSLAIEEQFYLVMPVLALLALRRRRAVLATALGVVAIGSFAMQLVASGSDRIYFGTDTRAAEIAIGGLLALGWQGRQLATAAARRVVDVAGWLALATTVALWTQVELSNPVLYRGALVAIALQSAILILGAVEGRTLSAVLRWRPLVLLGRVSYGVYLFHFPVFVLVSPDTTELRGPTLLGARLALTLAAAAASYTFIEWPVRGRRVLRVPAHAGSALVLAVASVLALTLLTTGAITGSADSSRADLLAGGLVIDVPESPPPVTADEAVPVTATAPQPPTVLPSSGTSTTTVLATSRRPAFGAAEPAPVLAPARAPRVLVIGDSTAVAIGAGLQSWARNTGRMEVAYMGQLGCPVMPGIEYALREGWIQQYPPGCRELFQTAVAEAQRFRPDVVVVWTGTAQLADIAFDRPGEFRHLGEADIDSRYVSALTQTLRVLGGVRVPILWSDLPVPSYDVAFVEAKVGGALPGTGPYTWNNAARAARLAELTAGVVASQRAVALFPFTASLTGNDGVIPRSIRPDGLHLSEAAVHQIASTWLEPMLRDAYRAVVARADTQFSAAEHTTWSAG